MAKIKVQNINENELYKKVKNEFKHPNLESVSKDEFYLSNSGTQQTQQPS